MIQVITEPLINKLPRLNSIDFDVTKVRLQEISNDITLIFFDDFEQLSESNLASVILHYNLDPDKVGLVIDEVKIIKDPYIYKKAKYVINPSKVYIRPIHTHHLSRMVENSIQEYIETNSWESFDRIVRNNTFTISEDAVKWGLRRSSKIVPIVKNFVQNTLQNSKEHYKEKASQLGKTAALVGGGLAATYLATDHYSTQYANKDYAAPPQERSQLIATLRTLTGKFSAYESEYDRANEARKGILRKILDKIKATIRAIRNKLFGRNDYYTMNNNMGRY